MTNQFQKKKEEPNQQNQQEAVSQRIAVLQDNGIYRIELLHLLGKINESLETINKTIVDLGTESFARVDDAMNSEAPIEAEEDKTEQPKEEEDEDEFELPPPKKK